ncbi:Defensin [Frankliniella fusca]|uniref:Defensin n=1 Tax=Frankliniella fusca TaxID=407009 RepID=A0AAE1LDR2_9NEOP|nr:Defensin [Frankliniella fusca]
MGHLSLLLLVVLAASAVRADDEELVDSPRPSGLTGPCEPSACAANCKQQKHAGGRCDDETCVCQDFKNKGRCAVLGIGCGVNFSCPTCNNGGGGMPPPSYNPPPVAPPPMAPKPPCTTCGIGGMPFFNANSFVINKEGRK